MAELGVAASILSIAAIGSSLATTLYQQADVLIHAQSEINSMAKHVTRFAAVLRHMGQVLKAEKGSCSEEMLRDIRQIKQSCKNTFNEINSTVKSKRSRLVISFKWMFKKAKVRELEARLQSLQSMLQFGSDGLEVSRLAFDILGLGVYERDRSREDSGHVSTLTTEIKLLKTFVIENYKNLEELRRAEQEYGAAETRMPSEDAHKRPKDSPGTHRPHPQHREPQAQNIDSVKPRNRQPNPSLPRSETEVSDSDGEDEENSDLESEDEIGPRRPKRVPDMNNIVQKQSPQPPPPYDRPPDTSIHRESNLLLQMVPYNPASSDQPRSLYLLTGGQVQNSDGKSGIEEATNSVRLLLDKWTNPGSAPLSDLLDKEAAMDLEMKEEMGHDETARANHIPRQQPTAPSGPAADEADWYPNYSHLPEVGDEPRYAPHVRAPIVVPRHNLYHKKIWRNSDSRHVRNQGFGEKVLEALRSTGGGIVHTKRNKFVQYHYVDNRHFATCSLVPSHMIPCEELEPLCTELGLGLVRKEALDLLGYSYEQTPSGQFSIAGDLDMRKDAIEEVVGLSYRALDRNLKQQSERLIEERGLRREIDARNDARNDEGPAESPVRDRSRPTHEHQRPDMVRTQNSHPPPPPGFPGPPAPPRTTRPYRPFSESEIIHYRSTLRERSAPRSSTSDKEEIIQPSSAAVADHAKEDLISIAAKKNGAKRQHGRKRAESFESPTMREYVGASMYLEINLPKRLVERAKAGDFESVARLVNQEIPGQRVIVEKLGKKVDEEKAQGVKSRHPGVETGSEGSDGDDSPTTAGGSEDDRPITAGKLPSPPTAGGFKDDRPTTVGKPPSPSPYTKSPIILGWKTDPSTNT
ncbi:MAG: hypothetical protein Q9226_002469 [Calogaya cf. arnoldii]